MRYETVTDSFIQLPEKSAITGKKVRVQITPLKVVDPSGEEITVPSGEKYLPLTGGTLTGNLNVNANLYVQNKKIEPVTYATDAQTQSMLDGIFGS